MGFIGEDEETTEIELVPGRELTPETAPREVPATPATPVTVPA